MDDRDETEIIRRKEQAAINSQEAGRDLLEKQYGTVWSTPQLERDFEVIGFKAPYVIVRRRSDHKLGSLKFQHSPRFYFNWSED